MQGAGFSSCGIDATYELIEVHPDDIPSCISRLQNENYSGWNITVPHKQAMATLVDKIDQDAQASGTVNTVVNKNGKLYGYSTDGYGIATAVKEDFGLDLAEKKITFIGTGGAASAVAVYLAQKGLKELILLNRTVSKAEKLANRVRTFAPKCSITVSSLNNGTPGNPALIDDSDLLIQSTSLGLKANAPLPLLAEYIPKNTAVLDMIYGNTSFLQAAKEQGCPTADGRGMLLHQGVLSFKLWTGVERPPVEAMRSALRDALQTR